MKLWVVIVRTTGGLLEFETYASSEDEALDNLHFDRNTVESMYEKLI